MKTSRRAMLIEMAKYTKPDTAKGLGLFFGVFIAFWASTAGVLLLPSLPLKVAASVVAALQFTSLFTLGHDAAHNSLTSNKKLNKAIALAAFSTCLINFDLWVHEHLGHHHAKTNGAEPAAFKPASPAQYAAMSSLRKFWERLMRSNPLFLGINYFSHRWTSVEPMPGGFIPNRGQTTAWVNCAFVTAFLAAWIAALALAPLYSATGTWTALILGLAFPYWLFQTLLGTTLYAMHTHPAIPWFDREDGPIPYGEGERLALHIKLPRFIATLVHNVYEHPAHHIHPAIPCYRLWDAQMRLNEMLGDDAIVETFRPRRVMDNMAKCKLYDYARHQWTDFDGNPTTGIIVRTEASSTA